MVEVITHWTHQVKIGEAVEGGRSSGRSMGVGGPEIFCIAEYS